MSRHYWPRALLLLSLGLFTGCQGVEGLSIQGVDLGNLVSAGRNLGNLGAKDLDEEQQIGQGATSVLLEKAPLLADQRIQRYVNLVGVWIALHSERPELAWRFAVLDSPSVGAYAAPGGYIVITNGLLQRLNSEAELAGVLAHEIAHVVQKHHLTALQQQAQSGLLSDLALLAAQASQVSRQGGMSSKDTAMGERFKQSVSDLYSRGLQRSDEYEADTMGVVLARRAGYDAYGLASVLQLMSSERADTPALVSFLKVHPNLGDRLQALEKTYQYLDKQAPNSGATLAERYQGYVLLP
ncbi:Peptidase family M48 [Atopomonas hussainii]|uniref:Peptidase family M48 n=1 Tax=Atopomonas hussainii TaxID=1429083 RepID=A0A1H7SSD5_9GAMM|nr:M48 family metalloprotease [Atopomonas hussainii]SEL74996.1 Peptidase family M48 [Atopomonas hussainii]